MRTLIVRIKGGPEFLAQYLSEAPHGGLFVPTRRALEPGEPVLLDVRIGPGRDHTLIRGVVAFRQRGKRGTEIRAGLGVEFRASEECKRQHLIALAAGDSSRARQRKHRRLPVELEVDWRVPSERARHVSQAGDIGNGGAFIYTDAEISEGTPLLVDVRPPGAGGAQTIEGRVAWRSQTPGSEGIGVEFRCRDVGGQRRLRELVKRFELAEAP